ncbi:DUF6236 family protein [Exiguobacterium sp. s149]|uniref:DUF6236 family protein n=1 Tax=Exiguobacterium TaxID=33986 RepID=UPI001BE54923|nr:DUF6236 family protein [Exiguobacterium sp. s149]
MRGIVISPQVDIIEKNRMIVRNSNIDQEKLREYVMYWDQIDFPVNQILHFGDTPETDYLVKAQVMKRSKINLQMSGELVELFLKGQLEAFRINNANNPGSWSLAQSGSELVLPQSSTIMTRNLEIELYNCLPVPKGDVSLDDILNFKEVRNDELLEFRQLIDDIYLEIINSGDHERALVKNIENIKRKIIELNKIMDESRISRAAKSLKIEFDVKDIISNGAMGFLIAQGSEYPIELGMAAGALFSAIKISSEISIQPKEIPPELKGYAYLHYSHKELGVEL